MNKKIDEVAKKLGFCCEHAMLLAYSKEERMWTAKKTKLSHRTVQYSYAKLKAGSIQCLGVKDELTCMIAANEKKAAKK